MLWGAVLGLAMGGAILSRQWGFFLVPPIVLLAFWRMWRQRHDHPAVAAAARSLSVALAVMFVSGGWYYVHLYRAYGTITAFNRPQAATDQARSPSFYFSLPLANIVQAPTQDHFHSRNFPYVLYCDTWGDYWLNFLVYGKDGHGQYLQGSKIIRRAEQFKPAETNLAPMLRYLGRVNIVSIGPTLLLVAGLIAGVIVRSGCCVPTFR
jgi:4-amino-4-deoxy-L-arabinose transferase-like glycosyltransferase